MGGAGAELSVRKVRGTSGHDRPAAYGRSEPTDEIRREGVRPTARTTFAQRRTLGPRTLALAAVLLMPAGAAAQVPDTFTNLQYFPEEIARDSLIGVMRQFSFALRVPCRYCHAGGPEDDPFSLGGVDFASDEKIEKRRARYMLRMVERINDELLAELPSDRPGDDGAHTGASRVRVECRTCHRGLPRPRMIDDIVAEKIREEGVEAAVAHYRELRERHYGDWRYDFGARVMIELGRELAGEGRASDAAAILAMMTEYHPESTAVWLGLGDAQRLAGRREDAIASYRRVLELSPQHAGARRRLREMGAPEAGERR